MDDDNLLAAKAMPEDWMMTRLLHVKLILLLIGFKSVHRICVSVIISSCMLQLVRKFGLHVQGSSSED